MTRSILSLAVAACTLLGTGHLSAQSANDSTSSGGVERLKLAGPRFGFTVFTGDVAKLRQSVDKEPIMSQFGWQFETQIAALESQSQALLEWVVLVGGVEQDELNVSLSWLAGYRMPNGFELGAGPAISTNKDTARISTSMILAAGVAMPMGAQMRLPFHVAVALARGGPRITTLVGWTIG